jgi:hypothetical protein
MISVITVYGNIKLCCPYNIVTSEASTTHIARVYEVIHWTKHCLNPTQKKKKTGRKRTQCHTSGDSNVQRHWCENFKFHMHHTKFHQFPQKQCWPLRLNCPFSISTVHFPQACKNPPIQYFPLQLELHYHTHFKRTFPFVFHILQSDHNTLYIYFYSCN